jgi:mono-ADP-ribosyltransferase sirtuin 6
MNYIVYRKADLCLCLGTSLQIVPCGNYPLLTKKNSGKICIVNLQVTKQDKKADLKINAYVDVIMKKVKVFVHDEIYPY